MLRPVVPLITNSHGGQSPYSSALHTHLTPVSEAEDITRVAYKYTHTHSHTHTPDSDLRVCYGAPQPSLCGELLMCRVVQHDLGVKSLLM